MTDDQTDGFAPSTDGHRLAFTILNCSTAPVWLAMILFPRARATAWLVRATNVLFVGIGATYTALLVTAAASSGERVDVTDPDSLRRAMANPTGFLAGWAHYLAFDLFVGRWIWQSNLDQGRTARLPLLLTWWLGPIGLTLELGRRARRWRRS